MKVNEGRLEYQAKNTTNHEEWTLLESPKKGIYNISSIEFSDAVTVKMRYAILIVTPRKAKSSLDSCRVSYGDEAR